MRGASVSISTAQTHGGRRLVLGGCGQTDRNRSANWINRRLLACVVLTPKVEFAAVASASRTLPRTPFEVSHLSRYSVNTYP
jgi:hypothetical protein